MIPSSAEKVLDMLGIPTGAPARASAVYGLLPEGQPLGSITPLFPRLDIKKTPAAQEKPHQVNDETKTEASAAPETPSPASASVAAAPPELAAAAAAPPETPAAPPEAELVGVEAFGALDLRTAKVTAAEKIKGSKKLLKLQLDVGGVPRQIVSGIAEAYEPEQLVGRTIIVIANLKPAKLMGVESHGMLLAATVDGKAVLAGFEKEVPTGTRVK